MTELEKIFAEKKTENGDVSYNTTGNNLLDILFMTSYYEKHLEEAHIGDSEKEKWLPKVFLMKTEKSLCLSIPIQ